MNTYTVTSRVRFARNLKDYPFCAKITSGQKKEVCLKVKEAFFGANSNMKKDYDYIELESANIIDLCGLAQSNLISPQFAEGKEGAILLKKDKTVSIMLCEEDHIRIQVILPGYALNEAYKEACQIDALLNERLALAYSEKYGYLTSCPTNLGTGMRASLMLHLPAVTEYGAVDRLVKEAERAGVIVRGANGEGTRAFGSLYQLSNRASLGISEKEIIERVSKSAEYVVNKEKELSSSLLNTKGEILKDKIMRAVGVLKYARVIKSEEFVSLYSLARWACEINLISMEPRVLDNLYFNCCAASIASKYGKELSSLERAYRRAEICREALK